MVTCSNPLDAYWMLQQAIADDDPVVFLEPKRRYHEKERSTWTPRTPFAVLGRVVKPGEMSPC